MTYKGQMGIFGTGSFQLILDMEKMKKLDDIEVDIKNNEQEIEKMFGLMEDKTDVCSKNNIEIQNNIYSIKQPDIIQNPDDDYDIGF